MEEYDVEYEENTFVCLPDDDPLIVVPTDVIERPAETVVVYRPRESA